MCVYAKLLLNGVPFDDIVSAVCPELATVTNALMAIFGSEAQVNNGKQTKCVWCGDNMYTLTPFIHYIVL